jgi:hypothetical protein
MARLREEIDATEFRASPSTLRRRRASECNCRAVDFDLTSADEPSGCGWPTTT